MKKFLKSQLMKKFLWTAFFLFIYVLGSKLTLPFVDFRQAFSAGSSDSTIGFATAIMGGNLRSMSFFSIGLSPWMSSILLWQMFSVSKKLGLNKLTAEEEGRRRMYLTLVIAVIQSLAVVLNLPLKTGGFHYQLVLLLDVLILIAGTFFLIWLADLNAAMGLGGSLLIVMASMISYLPQDIWTAIHELNISYVWVIILLIFSLLFLYLAVVFERAKYRIPISKINIHNRFKKYSHLDIKLNPAGGTPIMYAMTLVSLPQYLLLILFFFMPHHQLIQRLMLELSMGRPAWLILYLLTIFFLAIAFSFVNVSGDKIAKEMQKSGEYIDQVYPGRATRKYINRIVSKFALVGAVYLVTLSGLPMLMILWDSRYLRITMIPGIFMIFIGMVFAVKDEVDALTINEKYQSLL